MQASDCTGTPGAGRSTRLRTAIITLALLAGCATAPLEPGSVENARARYAEASAMQRIFDFAASSMRQAQQHLDEAERLLAASGSQADVDHHGFLSRQHVAIAEARLRRGLAQEDLELAQEQRRSLLLEARRVEAAAAAQRAQAIEDELAETRMQLRMAEERAKALADRLVEAGVTSSLEPD